MGRGGFGIVYRAEDTALGNREVALKVLHPQLVVDPASVRLFTQEAGTAARLRHRHIVTIYEADTYQDRRYIAMEFLPGPSLAALLASEGPQPVERVTAWMEQAASALDLAHLRGVVHRDLKPSNLLLDAEGQVMVTDFGLARATEASGGVSSSRDSGIMTGTARYMAPEQARWGEATAASDVYSLGVVAYELLTGHAPFEKGDAFAIALQQINEPPPPLRQFCPELPEAVEQAVLKALAKEPAERYPSAGAFADALRETWRRSQSEERRRATLAEHYVKLQALEQARDWSGAVAEAVWLEEEASGYLDVPGRLAAARERLRRLREAERQQREALLQRQRESEQRDQEVDQLYDTLLERRKAGDWASVLDLAAQIDALVPSYQGVQEHQAWATKRRTAEEERRQRERRQRDEARRRRLALYGRRAASGTGVLLALAALGLLVWWGVPRIGVALGARATARFIEGATARAMVVTPDLGPAVPVAALTSTPRRMPATSPPTTASAQPVTALPTPSATQATAVPEAVSPWGPLLRAYVDYGCARGWSEGAQGTAEIELTGPDGGRWAVTLSGDGCTVADGDAEAPSAVLRMSTADLAAILAGEASLETLRDQGKIELTGENEALKAALLQIASLLSNPVGTPVVVEVQVTATPRPKPTSTPARTPVKAKTATPVAANWSWKGHGPFAARNGAVGLVNYTDKILTVRIAGSGEYTLGSANGTTLAAEVAPGRHAVYARTADLAEVELAGFSSCPSPDGIAVLARKAVVLAIRIYPPDVWSAGIRLAACPWYEEPDP